jgi:hypothetical protein
MKRPQRLEAMNRIGLEAIGVARRYTLEGNCTLSLGSGKPDLRPDASVELGGATVSHTFDRGRDAYVVDVTGPAGMREAVTVFTGAQWVRSAEMRAHVQALIHECDAGGDRTQFRSPPGEG